MRKPTPSPNPLKALRKSAGVTMQELAALIGVTPSTVNLVESGWYASLPPSWGPAIEALGGDYDELAEAYATWKQRRVEATLKRLGK